jgi:hypothetical protein
LKIKAAKIISGAGTFDCGTSLSHIPLASKHSIGGGTGWYIQHSGGLKITVYAAEPTIKIVHLTGAEAIGQTVLEIDTDVTGDIWADGDEIGISDVGFYDSEIRTIAAGGIAAGSITVTAGLSAAKVAGAVAVLITRNVKFLGTNYSAAILFRTVVSGSLDIHGGYFTSAGSNSYIAQSCPVGFTIDGGFFHGSGFGFGGNEAIVNDGVFWGVSSCFYNASTSITINGGYFIACTQVFYQLQKVGFINGGVFEVGSLIATGTNGIVISNLYSRNMMTPFSGCGNMAIYGGDFGNSTLSGILSSCSGVILGGTFGTGNNGILLASMFDIRNAVFVAGSGKPIIHMSTVNMLNCDFTGVENSNYSALPIFNYSDSIDHDQVSGAYKAWTAGGITTKQAVTKPIGYASAMQTLLESATKHGYWQKETTVGAGASIGVEMQLRKDAAMTYLPRCIVFNKASTDPFAGGAGLKTFTMTDSIDTWESDIYTYTNTGTEDVTLVIRCQGMNATGNMYSALEVEQINVDLTSVLANQVLIMADLNNPDQYKANVSALALAADLQDVEDKIDVIATDTTTEIPASITAAKAVVDAVKLKTDNLPSDPADQSILAGLIAAIPAGLTVNDILTMVADGTLTFQQSIKLWNAALAGKLSGGGTGTLAFRDPDDTVDRITTEVDLATGDRDTQTYDLS